MKPVKFLAYDRVDRIVKRVYSMDYSQWWVGTGYGPGEGERNSFTNEPTDRHMLMQYIGLCDKQGTEIYSGFLVDAILHGGTVERFVVVYDSIKLRYILMDEYGNLWGFDSAADMMVVGNIYENRDLLISAAWRALTIDDFPEPKIYERDPADMATANPDFIKGNPYGKHFQNIAAKSNIQALADFIFGKESPPAPTITTTGKAKIYPFPVNCLPKPISSEADFRVGDRVVAILDNNHRVYGVITAMIQNDDDVVQHLKAQSDVAHILLDDHSEVRVVVTNLHHLLEAEDYVSVMLGNERKFGTIITFVEDTQIGRVAMVEMGDRIIFVVEQDMRHERKE
jgi:hypothetical protein